MSASKPNTALILIDVYNDFLHKEGKLNLGLSASLEEAHTIDNLTHTLNIARRAKLPIYYSLHQQYRKGKYNGFQHLNAMLESVQRNQAFEEGSWGAEVFAGLVPRPEDVVISKHWNQSSFKNTDLDWR
jgi:nicotinamidase-related amidase